MVQVKKWVGYFPEKVNIRGILVEFNAEGVADVEASTAEFLKKLPNEYAVADAKGKFARPMLEAAPIEQEAPSEGGNARVKQLKEELSLLKAAKDEEIEQLKAQLANAAPSEAQGELESLKTETIPALQAEIDTLKEELKEAKKKSAKTAPPAAPVPPRQPAAPTN